MVDFWAACGVFSDSGLVFPCFPEKTAGPREWNDFPQVAPWRLGSLRTLSFISRVVQSHKGICRAWLPEGRKLRDSRKSILSSSWSPFMRQLPYQGLC